MKKYLFGLIALAFIAVLSAFTLSNETKPMTGDYFYRYTGPANPIEDDIKEVTNYQRYELSCEDGNHVCGVFLATDGIEGAYPQTNEFNSVKDDLWLSETQGYAELPDIAMKE